MRALQAQLAATEEAHDYSIEEHAAFIGFLQVSQTVGYQLVG